MDKERIAKLPQWAQAYIRSIKSRSDSKDQRLATMVNGTVGGAERGLELRYVAGTEGVLRDHVRLPDDQRVRLYPVDGSEAFVEVYLEEDRVVLYSDRRLNIRPRSSNVAELKSER